MPTPQPLNPRQRNLLQLAHSREHGILTEGRLANILATEYDLTPTRFWQQINELRHDPAAWAEFPALMGRLNRRVATVTGRRTLSRGSAA